jgi:penicillin V acylase-like amidase (Ntn superfamily)
MKKRIALALAISFIFACMLYPAYACTVFNAVGNQMLLAGNNEEHEDPNGEIRFEPAIEGKYGTITFAYGPFTQGGMNEQGLFFDTYAPNYFKASPWIPGQLLLTGELPDRQIWNFFKDFSGNLFESTRNSSKKETIAYKENQDRIQITECR